MHRQRHNIWHLIVGISGLSVLGWFINSMTPDSIPTIALFMFILSVTVFFSSLFLLKIVRRAALVTLGVLVWLILRLLGLREFWYPLLLIPCLISLEMLFQKR